MRYWDHPRGYLAEARRLMSLSAEDLRRDEAWVLLVDETIAGFYRLSRARERAEIEEFHLEPPMIGRGIGRRMFEHAAERARAGGARWLVWSTDSNALGFYLHMGGEITGTTPSGIAGEEPLTCSGWVFGRHDARRGEGCEMVLELPREMATVRRHSNRGTSGAWGSAGGKRMQPVVSPGEKRGDRLLH
jgi:GNAT superfamily N-acetyltransferase